MRRSAAGMTLVELLIALAVFGLVLAMTYTAITGSLRVQAQQEAATTSQAKLRRVVEVISQDLRSAVFGSITDNPYAADGQQVSFMLLAGGAGYPVLDQANFANSNSFDVLINDTAGIQGSQVALVNRHGQGVVVPVSSISNGSNGSKRFTSSTCRNTIDFADSVLMFHVVTVGIRFDADDSTIYMSEGDGAEQPFAFDISDLRLDYVYTHSGRISEGVDEPAETVLVESVPHRSPTGHPVRTHTDADGNEFTLTRLQLVIQAEAQSGSDSATHAYSGQVDLSRAAHFEIEEIVPCK